MILYIATISVAQIDVDRLFHANPPTGAQSDVHVDESSDYSPFRGPRNDEFDWALTKVSCSTFKSEEFGIKPETKSYINSLIDTLSH